MNINKNYNELQESYLFSRIAEKVAAYRAVSPTQEIINLGIGDVTRPLGPAIISALQKAVNEMGMTESFHGYGPEQGYLFLREAISQHYTQKGTAIQPDEVFISDGAKSDLGNILDIFSTDNTVLISDPVYPVYVDTNIMAGRNITYVTGSKENGFLPLPEQNLKADIIYLCSPNNPTGSVYSKEDLTAWVQYARSRNAIILFDSAYEAFIQDTTLPTSIYQIDGAKECAIEFCSFSKTAGFTGLRCGYTIIPKDLVRNEKELNRLWFRRQATKFNGVPYLVQRAAEAVFSDAGRAEVQESIHYYRENARLLADFLEAREIWFTGGRNAPYLWIKCPGSLSSWEFFDYLLDEKGIVGTPGVGFGCAGEGFFRLSSFGSRQQTLAALERLKTCDTLGNYSER